MGAFKLGKMTFGSLFKKPETVLYPIESKPKPAGLKGHIALDASTCILCGMCERSCATDCITVDKAERVWRIDRLQCVQCGYCITVCPKKSLSMDPDYAPATTTREPDCVEVPEVEKAAAKPAAKAAGEKPAAYAEPKATDEKQAEPAAAVKDAQLEALLGLMDEEKSQKVREALARR